MSIEEIYNYLKVNDELVLSGQPREEQLQATAEEGFTTVINLATISPRYSLKDEAGLVQALGMRYYHIPVEWEHPTPADFEAFEKIFKGLSTQKTLVHCAANFRVTAFYSLYGIKNLGWSEQQAADFRSVIWKGTDNPVWEKFIAYMKTSFRRDE